MMNTFAEEQEREARDWAIRRALVAGTIIGFVIGLSIALLALFLMQIPK